MRTRNADPASKSAAPKKTPPPRKSPAAKRTPAIKTRSTKKKELSPVPDSNPLQLPLEQNSIGSASGTKSTAKRRTPGRPRVKAVDAPIGGNTEAAEKVQDVDAGNIEGGKEGEHGVGSVGLSDETEQKSMEVDEPVVEKVCESVEKGNDIMEVEGSASLDASVSFKRPGRPIMDLNISADSEDCIGEREGEKGNEELRDQEGNKGKEELKDEERDKGKEELKDQERDKEKEELKELERDKGKEELKEQEGDKGKEELKELDGNEGKKELKELDEEKGKKELDEEKGKEELKELEGEKGKEELTEQVGEKGKGELTEHDGQEGKVVLKELEVDKGKEQLTEQEPQKAKGGKTNLFGHEEITESFDVDVKGQMQKEDANPIKDGVESMESGEKLDLGEQQKVEHVEEELEEDLEEPPEETEALLEEHRELEAIANQRKIKKEHEIFVGGLDRDATEDDLRKVFQRIGEIVEVRLHKNSSTNKNKGYAFVKFANKEHAKKALSEMKNPVIHGKRCGTAPSEDNDTLFLGNICNTWTKEAIKQKLKDYGIEEVESITLVPDVQQEGLSRGFAFLEFSCHADAMLAYKRLQKPDVIFGHADRTAKVAFAEPIREPDPEVMAQVKSVFINGLPPHWDEDHVRELFKSYGEIVRIVLARNMSTAKRKDYGFVDFSTHEAAVACVDGVNKSELGDGASKIKVRARLSNPLPKTQAVKGGMCGGFRIGHARSGGGAFLRPGRGFVRGRQPFNNRGSFNRGRSFYHGGHNQIGRMGFQDDHDFNMHPDFRQRQFGPPGATRGGHYAGSRGAAFAGPTRPYHDRPWYGVPDGGPSELIPPRRPYSPGGQFEMPFMGRHFDDPYLYDDNMHGMKRPFYMTDPEPDYPGPNRLRPRLDYADPPIFHGTRHHDSFGASSRQYPPDYYGSDYGRGSYSSYYGGDGSHGHGYYY